jgi:predicted nucleic acid-binding protein
MIIDTDIVIWYLRGNKKAQEILLNNLPFSISCVTYMELVQGMRNKEELRKVVKQLQNWKVPIIHIDQDISSRAMFLVEEYSLSHSMALADAFIAATVIQHQEMLITANEKYYKFIPNIRIRNLKIS